MITPVRIRVGELVRSRYSKVECTDFSGLARPADWDERYPGEEEIRTTDGSVVKLLSNGAQPTPQAGWELLLTAGDDRQGYVWTLYGMPKSVN